jgi:hypothetical protein
MERAKTTIGVLVLGLVLGMPILGITSDDVGLLLGVRWSDSSNGEPPQYETLWIEANRDTIQLASRAPGLLLPGKDGFSTLTVGRWQEARDFADYPALWSADVAPEPAAPTWHPDCGGEVEARVTAASSHLISLWLEGELSCGGHQTFGIERYCSFSPQTLGTEANAGHDVRGLCRSAAELFGEATAEVLRVEGKRSLAGFEPQPEELSQCCLELSDQCIGMDHSDGAWKIIGCLTNYPYQGSLRFPLPLIHAMKLPQVEPLSVNLERLRQSRPAARDAVISPDGGIVVVLTREDLLVFRGTDSQLGRPQFETALPIDSTVVMSEWVLGPQVEDWRARIPEVMRRMPASRLTRQ